MCNCKGHTTRQQSRLVWLCARGDCANIAWSVCWEHHSPTGKAVQASTRICVQSFRMLATQSEALSATYGCGHLECKHCCGIISIFRAKCNASSISNWKQNYSIKPKAAAYRSERYTYSPIVCLVMCPCAAVL